MDRYIEGHDTLMCNVIRLHYLNVNNPGIYDVVDISAKSDDDTKVIFSWLITSNVTHDVGKISFAIKFQCVQDSGEITYEWSTKINDGLSCADSINNSKHVVEHNVDILEQWKRDLFGAGDSVLSDINAAKDEAIQSIDKVLQTIPEDYTQMQNDVTNLKGDIFYLRRELYGTAINIKDLSLFDKINAFATSAGAWSQVGNTQYEAVVIPVPVEGCTLKMTGNNLYGTYYIGAKTLTTPSELSPIDLSADWNNRKYANPNESIEVTIPSDASYVLIWVKIDNVDCSPSNFAITKGGSSGDIQQIEEIAKGVVIIDVDLSNAKDGYVDANNNIFDSIGQTYNYKYCIKRNIVAGDVVTIDSNWTISDTIYAIAKIVNGVITGVVHGVEGANIYSWTADTDCDVIFSYRGDKINTATIKTNIKNQLLNLDNRTTELEKKVYKDDTDYMYMFRKIGMIGDSLGSGEITWLDEQGVYHGLDIFTNSWCYYICKSIGADVVHYSKGGASLSSWFNDFASKLATDEPCNAYYIALGTNDANASDFNIGTINDTTTMETYTGRMKKLIEYVHQYAPHAVIFLMTMYGNVGTNPQLINAMIPQIADLYDYVYCIDFVNESDILKTIKDNDFTSEYHFTTNGYLRVANNIKRITNDVIRKNQTDFKYFAVNN